MSICQFSPNFILHEPWILLYNTPPTDNTNQPYYVQPNNPKNKATTFNLAQPPLQYSTHLPPFSLQPPISRRFPLGRCPVSLSLSRRAVCPRGS